MDLWISSSAYSTMPPMAVIGGHDVDQAPIFVGRSFFEGECLPAKVIPSKGCAYVCWGGEEISRTEYEVLTGHGYAWLPALAGTVPPNAVKGGNTRSGEPLYIGRANHHGSLCVGKVQPSHGCLYIPFGGREVRIDNYEVLVLNQNQHNWMPTTAAFTPPNAVVAGHDLDRTVLYVGRAAHEELKWVPSSAKAAIPGKAIIGGNDVNGDVIYVGRVNHSGNLLPVKIIPAKLMAYTSWCGAEINKEHFEVLCSDKCKWMQCFNHVIPENAVSCGKTSLGQPVYIGRGHYQGSLTVGRVSSVHRSLFIPFDGAERRLESYEILVTENINCKPGWKNEESTSFPMPLPVTPPPSYNSTIPIIPVPSAPPANSYLPPPYMPSAPLYPTMQPAAKPAEVYAPPMPMPMPNVRPMPMPTPMVKPADNYRPNVSNMQQGYSQHRWVPCGGSYTPQNAVIGGHDVDMSTLYVCRVQNEGNYMPGKYSPQHGRAYICSHGMELARESCEILVNMEKYHWVPMSDKKLPPGAVCGGFSRKGKPLFVGRGNHVGSLTPGYIKQSKNYLNISFGGRKHKIYRYEALVLSSEFYHGKHY